VPKKTGSAIIDLGSPLGGGSSLSKGKASPGTTKIGGWRPSRRYSPIILT